MDAFEFLETLSSTTLERLYEDPWACQAVFQALPALAQQFVMRLLTCDREVPLTMLEQWIHPLAGASASDTNSNGNSNGNGNGATPTSGDTPTRKLPASFHHALLRLTRLRVFMPVANSNGTSKSSAPHESTAPTAYRLNQAFQRQLRFALGQLGGSPWEAGRARLPMEAEAFTATDLERYARARWDAVLHFMVGSTAVAEPHKSVVDILLCTKLMHQDPTTRALHITDTGYEFMLQDIHLQMWIFLLEYIRTLDHAGALHQEEILQFLFQISYCQTNQYYAVADLTDKQVQLLADFTNFGLLYRQKLSSDRFYTTSLAVNLVFGGARGQQRRGEQQGRLAIIEHPQRAPTEASSSSSLLTQGQPATEQLVVVVETNFKVYAYTTSTLHVAMLSVFVDIVVRLPNLAIGFMTRESLRSALIHGISAQQIYDFLIKHAHPRMRQNSPVIPENIADQIYLWERERNRISFHTGSLFDGFNSKREFEDVLAFATQEKVLTWSDAIHFKLCIAAEGIDRVRQFIQHHLTAA